MTSPAEDRAQPLTAVVLPLLVAAAAVALWVVYGVGAQQIALFAAYEVAYVALPGIALHLLLRRAAPWREHLAYGWALGYALEVGAYSLAAAIGVRGVFPIYPLAGVVVLALLVRLGRFPAVSRPTLGPVGPAVLGAGVAVISLVYLGLDYFERAKLPWQVARASYAEDFNLHLALAADAQNHWPIGDPSVAGEPFFYHLGVDVHLAAAADVTGLPLPLVLFRLAVFPLTLVFVVCMCVAGRALFSSRWVGPIGAALALLVGDADVDPERWPFKGLFFTGFWISPSFLLGIALFIPAVSLIAARLADDRPLRDRSGEWIVVGVLLVACTWAKASAVPVLIGGLFVSLLVRRATMRSFDRNGLAALALAVGIYLAFYLAIYRHASVGLGLDPPGTLAAMPRVSWLRSEFAQWGLPSAVGWIVGGAAGILGMLGPALAGFPLLIWFRRRDFGPVRTLFASMLAVGAAAAFLLSQSGLSQLFFTHYGYAVGCLLSAEGLVLLAQRQGSSSAKAVLSAATFAIGWIVLIVVAARTPRNLAVWSVGSFGDDHFGDYGWRDVLAVAVFVLALAFLWRARRRAPAALLAIGALTLLLVLVLFVTVREQVLYTFTEADVAYGFIASALLLLAVLVVVARGARRLALLGCVALAAIATGAVGFPLDRMPGLARASDRHAFPGSQNVDRGLYDGLRWIRNHSPKDAVLAVDNYDRVWGTVRIPIFVDYAAFSERRVFLEGWFYSTRSWEVGASQPVQSQPLTVRKVPFPRRLRLNEAVFVRGDPHALATLVAAYKVRYLVHDRRQGHAQADLGRLGHLVYSNPSVAIYGVG